MVVQATGGKTFRKGTAVVTAEVFGCNEAICGTETDTEASRSNGDVSNSVHP